MTAHPSPVPSTNPAKIAELTDGDWHRLHPATPLLRGGIVFIVILGFVLNNLKESILGLFIPDAGGSRSGDDRSGRGSGDAGAAANDPVGYVVHQGLAGVVLAGIALLLIILIALFYVSWRMNTFRVTPEIVEVRSGIVFRTNRRARLDRIQGINIQRPVFARIFGAARLEINQAGHDANVHLAYLRSAEADDLRAEILRRASGTREQRQSAGQGGASGGLLEKRLNEFLAPPVGVGAPPQSVVSMRLPRLIGSAVLSRVTVVISVIVIVVVVSIVTTGQYFLLVIFFPTIVGSFGFYSRRIVKSLRYSIAATPDGIRIGWGLFSTSNETLPPGRIHSVKINQPLLWRPFGWWEVTINRASHSRAKGADGQANTTVLPVGNVAEVSRVLELILPELVGLVADDVEIERALERGEATRDEALADQPRRAVEKSTETLSLIEAGMRSTGSEGGFTTSPRRAAVLRWFSWRRNGFRTAPGSLLLRKGAIWRELIVVPLPRLQSVGLRQGPIGRRLRLASLDLHTVQGPIQASIGALDAEDARDFFVTASHDAVVAARADQTHRWLENPALPVPGHGATWAPPQAADRTVFPEEPR